MFEDHQALRCVELGGIGFAPLLFRIRVGDEISRTHQCCHIDAFQFVIERVSYIQLRGWIMESKADRLLKSSIITTAVEITKSGQILEEAVRVLVPFFCFFSQGSYGRLGIAADEIIHAAI